MHQTIMALLVLVASGSIYAHSQSHSSSPKAVTQQQEDWGVAGKPAQVKRTIEIRMNDKMQFIPNRIEIKLGETVRFKVKNTGKVLHEMVIGTKPALDQHAAMMLKHPNMEHDEAYMAHVEPGKDAEIIWTFNRPGRFLFACLIAGHYTAGMTGDIEVKL